MIINLGRKWKPNLCVVCLKEIKDWERKIHLTKYSMLCRWFITKEPYLYCSVKCCDKALNRPSKETLLKIQQNTGWKRK